MQRYNRKELDPISQYEKRFNRLKAYIQNHPVVGYISDIDNKSVEDSLAYGRTQYVLAPIILVRGIKRKFVIGNFQSAKPDIKEYEKKKIIANYGFRQWRYVV